MGLGAGSPLVLAPQGVAFERPLTRLREYCEVIPRLLAGEAVSYRGECVELDGARIEDVLAARRRRRARAPGSRSTSRRPARARSSTPARSPTASCSTSACRWRTCASVGAMAAAASGRAGCSAVEVGMCVVVSPHADARAGATRRGGSSRCTCRCSRTSPARPGSSPSVIGGSASAFADGGVDAAAPFVGDDVVEKLTRVGQRRGLPAAARGVPRGRRRAAGAGARRRRARADDRDARPSRRGRRARRRLVGVHLAVELKTRRVVTLSERRARLRRQAGSLAKIDANEPGVMILDLRG